MTDIEPRSSDDHRSNNFDFLRLLAAVLVLFSHCFPIAGIPGLRDPLARVTIDDEMSFGKLGVSIFFLISGYLITQSYERSRGVVRYCKARFLRIFPGLFILLVLCAYVMGPLITTLSRGEYFRDPSVHAYVRTVFLFPVYWELPGIFVHNHYKGIVNGSLWSIPYEFLCYILVAVLGLFRLHGSRVIAVGLVVFGFLIDLHFKKIFGADDPAIGQITLFNAGHACYPFLCGMLFYSFRADIVYRPIYACIAILVLYFCSFFGGMYFACCLAGGYLLFYYSFHGPSSTHNVARYGDFSYGVYLYSFPLQQLVVSFNGGVMGAISQFFVTLPLVFGFAFASWHIVEKRALALKNVPLLPRLRFFESLGLFADRLSHKLEDIYTRLSTWVLWASLVVGLVGICTYSVFTFPPSRVEFPFEGGGMNLTGGWLPQLPGEKYRWINKSAHVRLYAENTIFKLIIRGYIPENFKTVNTMKILINGNEVAHCDVRNRGAIEISLPLDLGVSNHVFTTSIVFDDGFQYGPDSPEKRTMSALITRVSVN